MNRKLRNIFLIPAAFSISLLSVPAYAASADSNTYMTSQAAYKVASAEARVAEASGDFVTAFNNNDAATLAKFYKRVSVLKLPGAPAVYGKQAIEATWQGGFDQGITGVTLSISQIDQIAKRKVLENGTFVLDINTPNGLIQQEGTYSVMWHVPRSPNKRPKIIFDTIDAN